LEAVVNNQTSRTMKKKAFKSVRPNICIWGLSTILLAVFLVGCATPARVEQMRITSMDPLIYDGNTPLKEAVIVNEVTGGRGTNPLWLSDISSEDFKKALEESLLAAQLLSESNEARYQLFVKMIKVAKPLVGFDMTVTAEVEYRLVRKEDNHEIMNEVVNSSYKAKFSDNFYGTERLRLANEGAGRENIKKIIDLLYALDIDSTEVVIEKVTG